MSRKETTLRLRRAAAYYFIDKNFSVYDEVGLKSGRAYSKLRADVLAFSLKGEIVIIEVKSCWQDWASDTKWESYLDFCNKMYFIIDQQFLDSDRGQHVLQKLKSSGIGLLVVSDLGNVRVVSNAKRRKVSGAIRRWIITKLAWRGGYCKASADRSMRFSCSKAHVLDKKISLIEFLGLCKADKALYLSKFPACGFKKYLNYPVLNTDKHL